MITAEIISFINTLKKLDVVVDVILADSVPDDILEEINNNEKFEIEENDGVTVNSFTATRTVPVSNDNVSLIDVTLKFNEDIFKLACVIHNEDFNDETEQNLAQGIERFKDYYAKSDVTRWMFRNRTQPVIYRPLDAVGDAPLPLLKTPYGELNPLDSLIAELKSMPHLKDISLGGNDIIAKAIKATDDPDAASINCTIILNDNSEDMIQIPVTKDTWSDPVRQRVVFDNIEKIRTDLNNKLGK